jgi:hypothetical protein
MTMLTPGGNPVCAVCGRDFCLCMTDEQATIANALVDQNYLSSRPIAKDFAACALNALAAAGYDVVSSDDT